jgi:ElaB/YqjD/DUF883 family membrane-anchored ribosome-binding protein
VKGIMESTATGTRRTGEKVSKGIKDAVEHGEDLARSTAADLEEAAKEGHAKLSAAIDSTKAACASLQDKVVESAKATDRVVREYPYPSLGVVFGLGLLIGILWNRRDSD